MLQRLYFLLVAVGVVFVFKNDITVIYVQYPVGGDGYLVCIAAQVFYYLRRATKRGIGIYIPFLLRYWSIKQMQLTFGFAAGLSVNLIA